MHGMDVFGRLMITPPCFRKVAVMLDGLGLKLLPSDAREGFSGFISRWLASVRLIKSTRYFTLVFFL